MKGLLVDFGGVLTTNVFDSFKAFCEKEGLDPDAVRRLFREDPVALAELRRLERGELTEDDFSERFGPMLGVSDTEQLVDRLFAGMGPDEPMIEAVKTAKRSGVKTGLISNSWGRGPLRPRGVPGDVRRRRDLGRGRAAQARARRSS